jgi:hypothetical protein
MIEPIKLPSGAELRITLAPFTVAKSLYQAVLEETKLVRLDANMDIDTNLLKDLFCIGLSSKKIEAALDDCMKRCLYNNLKITADTFEAEEARQDYITVCFEVGKANIEPFLKALMPKLKQLSAIIPKSQA